MQEQIKSEFSDLGFQVTGDILDKCVEICVQNNIDEQTIAETWAAYSVTYLSGEGPTVETLAQMERKEFQNSDKNSATSSTLQQATTPLTIYNKTPTSTNQYSRESAYDINTTPKAKGTQHLATQLYASSSKRNFSPASFSPISTSSESGNYGSRKNAGQVVCEFAGNPTPSDWKTKDRVSLTIAPYTDETISSQYKVMMEPLSEKAAVLNDVVERIGSHLIERHDLQEPIHNQLVSQVEIISVGRVVCDSNDHLNASSVLLEGSQQLSLGMTVPLDLSRLPKYSLFPGQVIAVQGTNPSGKKLLVNKLFASAPLPSPPSFPNFSGRIHIVAAAGPFTQVDSLGYEPLEDLMTYVKEHRPHVLILLGPLVDLRQTQLVEGSLAESYDSFYDKIIKGIMDQLKGSWTQVIVVSSVNEAACLPVYPTPPPLTQHSTSSLHFVSDPSLLSINGLVVALTATDALMHIGREEISFPLGAGDRLGRLASHLIEQQSMYPLYPSVEELNIDYDLWDSHTSLPVTPHIIIAPSNFRYFVKHINNCLVVNPEHLCKGTGGGTFVRLEVAPAIDGQWSAASSISAQVLRI